MFRGASKVPYYISFPVRLELVRVHSLAQRSRQQDVRREHRLRQGGKGARISHAVAARRRLHGAVEACGVRGGEEGGQHLRLGVEQVSV